MRRFDGKRMLVTGGGSGIGLATVERLVEEGAKVVMTGRNRERLERAAESTGAIPVVNDASAAGEAEDLAAFIDDALGGVVDGVFLNAGGGNFASVEDCAQVELVRQFSTNVFGPFLQVRELSGRLAAGSSVLFNTSIVNDVGMANSSVYAATKGAVRSAMKVMASEFAPRNIRVNAVSPGPIDTGFFAASDHSDEEIKEFRAGLTSMVPLGRFGTAAEVAAAAVFLLSPESSFITSAELVVDGGMS